MNEILNYIKIDELISTSGQPTVEQFQKIKDEGFEVVINLALCTATNAIENEDKIVTGLDLTYFHIPVDFENPKLEDAKLFLSLMGILQDKKVLVHCAKNYRVTAFMYLYHKHILNTPFEQIDLSIFDEWTPSKQWQDLMKCSIDKLALL
ncbi:protein tyrosine phosphatase family protein [Halarcobacter sp.]|uniref:protein tyrosine phosphatase family protein n=1 Tax=Halarcobacter sp. TaxID=2321133 RepID=UPI0029F57CC0|nr:protein tyrosine phosphatase family protein [Halarcobacter sp.]